MSDDINTTASGTSPAAPVAPAKPKGKRGRPKGYSPKLAKIGYQLKNGHITTDQIYLYVKKESLPKREINRFLQLCDELMIALGAEGLKGPDVEEIALLYRERVYLDSIYEKFVDDSLDDDTEIDTTMLKQIETLSKQLETRKENLSLRFKDLGKKREDTSGIN